MKLDPLYCIHHDFSHFVYVGYLIKYKGKTGLIAGCDETYKGDKAVLGNRVGNGLFLIAFIFLLTGLSSVYLPDYFQHIFIGSLLTISVIALATASMSS
ncbi:MAG: hypothetical protein AAGC88_05050 [Bacteroidota bacterium]